MSDQLVDNQKPYNRFRSIFGPGLMFAATSVGVSHIVQSTRAGAEFGLGLVVLVLVVNLIKYPAFHFGTRYALATGTTLLQGYRNIGTWALILYGLIILLFMPILFAAMTMGTSGVIIVITGTDIPMSIIGPLMMIGSFILVKFGGYKALEKFIKLLVVIFTVLTFFATIISLFDTDIYSSFSVFPTNLTVASIFFIVALIGWMPTGLEVSVWQSVWTLNKTTEKPSAYGDKQFHLDFNIGFVGTSLLAVCFIVLGTSLMHNSGQHFPESAPAFIAQVIDLYRNSIGEWCVPLIGICTLAVFFSTAIAVFDGYPRILIVVLDRFKSDEKPWQMKQAEKSTAYTFLIMFGFVGAYLLMMLWGSSFKMFIDASTTTSFVYGPIVAFLNHKAMYNKEVPMEYRPSNFIRILSLCGITILSLVACYYLYLRF